MDWEGLAKERIQVGLPLLVIKGSRGLTVSMVAQLLIV